MEIITTLTNGSGSPRPEDNRAEIEELIRAWNAGEPITVVNMGGLGPAYEACIWTAALAILHVHVDDELPALDDTSDEAKAYGRSFGQAALASVDRPGLKSGGLTGAQAGAARNAAGMFLRHGPTQAMGAVDTQRIVEIRRGLFPTIPTQVEDEPDA